MRTAQWWIPGAVWAGVLLGAVSLIAPRERGPQQRGTVSKSTLENYRAYLTELVDTVLRFHPTLEGVPPETFLTRVSFAYEELVREGSGSADGVLPPVALQEVRSPRALAKLAFPREGIDASQLDARLHQMSQAVLQALNDPFSQLLKGDLSLVLGQILPGTLGLFVDEDGGGPWISIVLGGSVAHLAGLRAGDRILRVNGTPAAELSLREARRAVESRCTLVVYRRGWDRAVPVTLDALPLGNVEPQGMLLDERVGYLKFGLFSGIACLGLQEEARRLESRGARAFLLDLRGNPGGVIVDALAIADMFLEPGLLIATLRRRPDADPLPLPETVWSSPRPWNSEVPLVLLIDRSSVSASELLAETLKDHHRALLVGETTYGKGVGQSAFPLILEGKVLPRVDLLFLTCLSFHAPQGYNVHGVGVPPDLRVSGPEHPAARVEFRGTLLAHHALLADLLTCELAPGDVQVLRAAAPEVPAPLQELAEAHRVALPTTEQRHAYRDLARIVLERRYPELMACPEVDPVVAKALRAAHVLLRE